MDALGAQTPEPDDMFDAIVAPLKSEAASIEQAVAAGQEPETAPAAPPPPPAPPAAPVPNADRERQAAPTPAPFPAPAAADLPVPKPPDLVVPPKPERPRAGVVDWWAKAFPHVVWLSVIAGLAGQVFGFAEFFGGGPVAWVVAAVLGGTFEFMMVACSSRGLRAIGLNRSWREFIPFLSLGTAAAGFAAYMNLNHFVGWLGLAAGMVSLIGYAAHVTSHLYEELEHRKELQAWETVKVEIEAELKARAEAERAEYDAYRAEVVKQRRESARKPVAAPVASATAPVSKAAAEKKPVGKRGGRASKSDALRVGVERKASTPAKLRDALTAAGYALPSSSTTLENWCRDIKTALAEAG